MIIRCEKCEKHMQIPTNFVGFVQCPSCFAPNACGTALRSECPYCSAPTVAKRIPFSSFVCQKCGNTVYYLGGDTFSKGFGAKIIVIANIAALVLSYALGFIIMKKTHGDPVDCCSAWLVILLPLANFIVWLQWKKYHLQPAQYAGIPYEIPEEKPTAEAVDFSIEKAFLSLPPSATVEEMLARIKALAMQNQQSPQLTDIENAQRAKIIAELKRIYNQIRGAEAKQQ